MSDEKTEEPTDHKLEQAREKGEVAKSQDVAVAASMLGVVLALVALGDSIFERVHLVMGSALDFGDGDLPHSEIFRRMQGMALQTVLAILPLLVVAAVFAALGLMSHVGLMVAMEAVAPKPEKLDPVAGTKRLFSLKSLTNFLMMVFKATVIGVAAWQVILMLLPLIGGAAYQSVGGIGTIAWRALMMLLMIALGLFIVLAPVDFALQRFLFMKDQRMSKDEVKREHKGQEGDPQLKGQRKQLMRENANGPPPRKAVEAASAVIVNPTHYAVAIRYVAEETGLPIVVAKGMDEEALRIRQAAQAHGVPVFSNPPLARALHKVDVGGVIPAELFEAVAAVLRWVDRLGRRPPDAAAKGGW
ncbi:type III secretion system export apparatus subunit SctU [Ramlibacter tataouinensis]|uniref:Candidate translocation protein in type III secretion, membrane protein n=1 Tax=Ramlibacter tataouinensis (strain ATCC BAA-407 / DSM 14655 / LMG 21543 / TTB310) TaxID=365046 RepID=F5XVX3_RAMTT|nr:type III secretion system export apparatus subunit SctU [Ramlibacter tataouinensis]AEG94076.1 Candidate translocation protein in type III secretion, membrane protein [Ramlibacter tataouinensis TTB310]